MPGTVQSLERAAAILQVVAGSGGTLGVTGIAAAVGLPKTTAHSLLRTLLGVRFVEQDREGRYALGQGLLRLGSGHLDVNELRSRASNWADALASRSGHAVRLATLVDARVLVVHHVFRPDDSAQVLDVGTVLPAGRTALGAVLAAFAPHRSVRALPDTGRAEVAAVRARGWAADEGGLHPGTAAVAVPVRGSTGLVVAALGIAGPAETLLDGRRQPRSRLVAMVQESAQGISRELGWHG